MDYTPFYMLSNDGRGVAVWGEKIVIDGGTGPGDPIRFQLYDDQDALDTEFELEWKYFSDFAHPELRIEAEEIIILGSLRVPNGNVNLIGGRTINISGTIDVVTAITLPFSPAIMLLLH